MNPYVRNNFGPEAYGRDNCRTPYARLREERLMEQRRQASVFGRHRHYRQRESGHGLRNGFLAAFAGLGAFALGKYLGHRGPAAANQQGQTGQTGRMFGGIGNMFRSIGHKIGLCKSPAQHAKEVAQKQANQAGVQGANPQGAAAPLGSIGGVAKLQASVSSQIPSVQTNRTSTAGIIPGSLTNPLNSEQLNTIGLGTQPTTTSSKTDFSFANQIAKFEANKQP